MKAIISGAIANKPNNGGNAWSRMSWVQGLKKLGWDVWFVEEITHCVDAAGAATSFGESVNLAYFQSIMERFELSHSSALIYRHGEQVHGLPIKELTSVAQSAQMLFNMGGHLTHPEIKDQVSCKIYYDDDPGFTQFWHAMGKSGARVDQHDFYFTIGENIGTPSCTIPTHSISWRHTRPPVLLEDWPYCDSKSFDRFTTVASWRGAYGPVQYDHHTYGVKAHEFRKYISLPQHVPQRFEIALQIDPADQKDTRALLGHGGHLVEPHPTAASPDAFRRYVQTSSAEFSAAQEIYVTTNSGWFSDRTVRYLASGKPVLVQDTGFSHNYPVGSGLLAFRTMDDAVEGVQRIVRDYGLHCLAARRLAEEYFNSSLVLRQLLAEIGIKQL